MIINRGRPDSVPSEQRSTTFTGEVWADPMIAPTEGVAVTSVFFPPGARTNWHTHSTGQVLLVTFGAGFVFDEYGGGGAIGAGDVVWISADERHWHGAGPKTVMSHIAVSIGDADWQDPVLDDDYADCVRAGP